MQKERESAGPLLSRWALVIAVMSLVSTPTFQTRVAESETPLMFLSSDTDSGRQWWWLKWWDARPPWGRPGLSSCFQHTPTLGLWRHLGSKPVNRFSSSRSLAFCLSNRENYLELPLNIPTLNAAGRAPQKLPKPVDTTLGRYRMLSQPWSIFSKIVLNYKEKNSNFVRENPTDIT